jgi:hypothetical protein
MNNKKYKIKNKKTCMSHMNEFRPVPKWAHVIYLERLQKQDNKTPHYMPEWPPDGAINQLCDLRKILNPWNLCFFSCKMWIIIITISCII